jgi:hypothetical protein
MLHNVRNHKCGVQDMNSEHRSQLCKAIMNVRQSRNSSCPYIMHFPHQAQGLRPTQSVSHKQPFTEDFDSVTMHSHVHSHVHASSIVFAVGAKLRETGSKVLKASHASRRRRCPRGAFSCNLLRLDADVSNQHTGAFSAASFLFRSKPCPARLVSCCSESGVWLLRTSS